MNIKQNDGRIERKKKMLNVAKTKEAVIAMKKESRMKAATSMS